MALATQCPYCQTTFRVAQDQLKLRSGLVRCGACKQIFNGIENLLRPELPAQADSPVSAPIAPEPDLPPPEPPLPIPSPALADDAEIPSPANTDINLDESSTPNDAEATAPPHDDTAIPEAPSNDGRMDADPLLRMTLMDFAHVQRHVPEHESPEGTLPQSTTPDPLDRAIDDLQRKPWCSEQTVDESDDELDQADSSDFEEPSFVRQGRRRQRLGRVLRVFMASATVVLLIALLAQTSYVFRDQIAARFPQMKPLLANACVHLGCQVGLPAQIDAVSIESSELQTLAAGGDTFALTVLLRNHGATDQTWPYIELTLNDNNEKPIIRRAFGPREYLGSEYDPRRGFAARSEQPVKLHFQLPQLKASGYRVYLFYP